MERRADLNLLTVEFLTELPPISNRAPKYIDHWKACLDWKRQAAERTAQGLRYFRVEIRDEELFFSGI
jgi:hypothetical protein